MQIIFPTAIKTKSKEKSCRCPACGVPSINTNGIDLLCKDCTEIKMSCRSNKDESEVNYIDY